MKEDYLHYLWEFQKWKESKLFTSEGFPVTILSPGNHNLLSGPDFFNSRVVIGTQQWAGNVEIHINSSDWFRHGHHTDPAYDNVVLHVVWNHDAEVLRKDKSAIPVVELKNVVSENSVRNYRYLLTNEKKWINCEHEFSSFDDFTLNTWLERLYIERLESRSNLIFDLLQRSSGDWEEVLFKMLAKNFGLNVNGDAFLGIASSIPFSVVRKCRGNLNKFEALLFGQAGLLEREVEEPYFKRLKQDYEFLRNKFSLKRAMIPVKYFRLRPDNFPEIRLSQFAYVYCNEASLFSEVIRANDIERLRGLFAGRPNDFWKTHYTFEKNDSVRNKTMSRAFMDLLIINTIVPLKFCYLKEQGREEGEVLFEIMRQLPKESNQVIKKFNSLRGEPVKNAFQSQALLELKKAYCDKNNCLHCSLGIKILQSHT